MNNSAAKVQKILEICKFIGKYFDTSEKSITFAATNLKDIHNKDYSAKVNIQSGTQVSLFFFGIYIPKSLLEEAQCLSLHKTQQKTRKI